MINLYTVFVFLFLTIFGCVQSQQPYQPIPANVRPAQPIQPPIQSVAASKYLNRFKFNFHIIS